MAFSGTVSTTVFNTDKLVTTAIRRCRIPAAQIVAEHWDIARNNLYLLLSELANKGIPLWCITKVILPLYEGVEAVTMPLGVVDVLNQNFRSLAAATGTNTDTSTSRKIDFGSATAVSTVGIRWSASSVPLVFERSDDNVNWTQVQTEAPQAVNGEWSWYDMTSVVASRYFRITATSGTLSFSQIFTGNTPSETTMGRMNRDQWAALPNKTFAGPRPLQFWFDRTSRYPVMHVWPVPNAAATTSQVVAWVHRHIMDVGTLTQEVEVPQRWYEAVVSGLARKMAREIPEVDVALIPQLDRDAAEALSFAQNEERDKSPMTMLPNISPYTR